MYEPPTAPENRAREGDQHDRQAAARARFAGDPDAQRIAVQAAIAQIRVGVAGPFQRRIVAQARRDGRI
jgi:hypothetical protein